MKRAATDLRISADWLDDRRLHRLFAAIAVDGDEAYVVGGAVRNTLLGIAAGDIDVATTARPEVVTARAAAAGLKPVPTGIDHGTVTVVVDGGAFEVTTLRRDVESHGRRATVAFGRDWSVDAHRRDFTMNALYVSLDGTVHDFVGGVADCRAGRVRFIGAARRRIAEDRLRILRFFRFHAAYGRGPIDADGLAAAIAARDGIAGLSAERIGQETTKLVTASGAPATVAVMSDVGILQRVLGRAGDLAGFGRLHELAAACDFPSRQGSADAALFLAALAGWSEADGVGLGERLRLSNADRDRMVGAVAAARRVGAVPAPIAIDRLLADLGRAGARDGVALAFVDARIDLDAAIAGLALAASRAVPELPIAGRDLLARGVPRGPEVGRLLAEARAHWAAADFTLDRDALFARLGLGKASILGNR